MGSVMSIMPSWFELQASRQVISPWPRKSDQMASEMSAAPSSLPPRRKSGVVPLGPNLGLLPNAGSTLVGVTPRRLKLGTVQFSVMLSKGRYEELSEKIVAYIKDNIPEAEPVPEN